MVVVAGAGETVLTMQAVEPAVMVALAVWQVVAQRQSTFRAMPMRDWGWYNPLSRLPSVRREQAELAALQALAQKEI